MPVYDLASALAAIDEIEDQGEGLRHDEVWDGDRDMFHPERDEVAHYFRFVEITQGRLFQRGDTPQSGPTGPSMRDRLDGGVSDARRTRGLDDYPGRQPCARADARVQPALLGPAPRPASRLQRRAEDAAGDDVRHVGS